MGCLFWKHFLPGFRSPPHLHSNCCFEVVSWAGAQSPTLDAGVQGQILTPKSSESSGETEVCGYSSDAERRLDVPGLLSVLREFPFQGVKTPKWNPVLNTCA